MARAKDPLIADVKRIRRKISRLLMEAHRHGRLHEELKAMERQGERAYKEAVNGSKTGNGKHPK
ncbi:MAG TPA: hypothetical protein VKU80_06455 [Planctomycetota bacterium]|nr:hypothetical protein [Planctomycetota bacterium]